jgi:fluoride exporter
MLQNYILVFVGGGLGSICRFAVGRWLNYNSTFPLGTFVANVFGCFLIGCIIAYLQKNSHNSTEWTLLLATGFCGGFTTFSTFAYENNLLLKSGNYNNFLQGVLKSMIL